ncbi:MAG: ImmA/IrrE family metallo-endopeptidase [Flavobacteriales bacterium]|nr:ImmA/IrrE family metallo-endopeptidase [Flavobacteriales bacterium]
MADIAYITPKVLKWARTTAKMSLETAAAKVNVTAERLEAWENPDSTDRPTIRQAEKLAHAYKRPFAMLFLPEVPFDFTPLQDFRRSGSKELTTAAVFIQRELQQKQAWMSDLHRENGEPPLPFVGRFSLSDAPQAVAQDILRTLNIDPAAYTEAPFREWMAKAEEAGIFISRTSFIHSHLKLDSDEFQGFAIADPHAPFVFINTEDWDAAQLFTLVHELAHLWIAATGISSDIAPEPTVSASDHPVERFCNAVAAHALMPDRVMEQLTASQFTNSRSIAQIAERYGVSSLAFLIRAHGRRLVSDAAFHSMRAIMDREFREHVRELAAKAALKPKSKSGPSYYLLQLNRNGRLFTQVVLDAFRSGIIQPTVASGLLNAPVNGFSKFEKYMYR